MIISLKQVLQNSIKEFHDFFLSYKNAPTPSFETDKSDKRSICRVIPVSVDAKGEAGFCGSPAKSLLDYSMVVIICFAVRHIIHFQTLFLSLKPKIVPDC